MPRVSRACAANMVPNLPAPIRPTVIGLPALSRSRSLACKFNTLSRQEFAQGKHSAAKLTSGSALLTERAGDECIGRAAWAGAAPGEIDLRRTHLGRRHVEALARGKPVRFTHD